MTTPAPTLIELIGPDAYVDTQARVFDEMFPLAGLGELLRDLYRLAVWSASRGQTAAVDSDADSDSCPLRAPHSDERARNDHPATPRGLRNA